MSEEALQIAEKGREAKGKGKIPKVMLKILQARLQQYMNRELPDVEAGFRKGRRWIIKKAREFQKKHLFLLY